jgi:hypothetical protein
MIRARPENLDEANTDALIRAPGDATGSLQKFWLNKQREIVGHAWACDFKASTCLGHVANNAFNRRRAPERNGAALIGALSQRLSMFVH